VDGPENPRKFVVLYRDDAAEETMKILIACEFSGVVRDAFLCRGHDAVSCDVLPTERPGPHIQDDVLNHLDDGWDMMIAHPPCTYLSSVGNAHFKRDPTRYEKRCEAFEFFMKIANANIDKICVENPVGYINTHYRKPDQIIHPYFFGDPFMKRTCLWLKSLPKLYYSSNSLNSEKMVKPDPIYIRNDGTRVNWCEALIKTEGSKNVAQARSKTFPGIADAMAKQWG
jgi:hypothetical protein